MPGMHSVVVATSPAVQGTKGESWTLRASRTAFVTVQKLAKNLVGIRRLP